MNMLLVFFMLMFFCSTAFAGADCFNVFIRLGESEKKLIGKLAKETTVCKDRLTRESSLVLENGWKYYFNKGYDWCKSPNRFFTVSDSSVQEQTKRTVIEYSETLFSKPEVSQPDSSTDMQTMHDEGEESLGLVDYKISCDVARISMSETAEYEYYLYPNNSPFTAAEELPRTPTFDWDEDEGYRSLESASLDDFLEQYQMMDFDQQAENQPERSASILNMINGTCSKLWGGGRGVAQRALEF